MTVIQALFYLFSAVAVFSGVIVVSSSNAVRGALFLVLTFFSTACLWMLLHAEFLSLILVLVYVGAVMTLFLFVVMMLSVTRLNTKEGFVRFMPVGVIVVLMVVAILAVVLGPKNLGLTQLPLPPVEEPGYSNTALLGNVIYTLYAYPFEVAGVILLTAIVAAISLTHRKGKKHKSQNIAAQLSASPANRLRLVDLPRGPQIKPDGAGE